MGVYHISLEGSNCFLIALSFVTKSTKYKVFVFKCSLVFQQYLHYPQRDNWIKTKVENSQALTKNRTYLEWVPQHSTGWRLVSPDCSLSDGDLRKPVVELCVGNLEQYFEILLVLGKYSDYCTTIWWNFSMMLFTCKITFCAFVLRILLRTKYPKEISCWYEAVLFVKVLEVQPKEI